jgi:hypothetical protein
LTAFVWQLTRHALCSCLRGDKGTAMLGNEPLEEGEVALPLPLSHVKQLKQLFVPLDPGFPCIISSVVTLSGPVSALAQPIFPQSPVLMLLPRWSSNSRFLWFSKAIYLFCHESGKEEWPALHQRSHLMVEPSDPFFALAQLS